MIYRPHFPYFTPDDVVDEPYEYFFDPTNTTGVTLPALQTVFSFLFQLDKDAEFRWRGYKVGLPDTDEAIELLWKDGFGNVLSDDTINLNLYTKGAGYATGFSAGQPVAWDEELICPPGGVIESNWYRPFATDTTIPISVTLMGVKRYYGQGKAA